MERSRLTLELWVNALQGELLRGATRSATCLNTIAEKYGGFGVRKSNTSKEVQKKASHQWNAFCAKSPPLGARFTRVCRGGGAMGPISRRARAGRCIRLHVALRRCRGFPARINRLIREPIH